MQLMSSVVPIIYLALWPRDAVPVKDPYFIKLSGRSVPLDHEGRGSKSHLELGCFSESMHVISTLNNLCNTEMSFKTKNFQHIDQI